MKEDHAKEIFDLLQAEAKSHMQEILDRGGAVPYHVALARFLMYGAILKKGYGVTDDEVKTMCRMIDLCSVSMSRPN